MLLLLCPVAVAALAVADPTFTLWVWLVDGILSIIVLFDIFSLPTRKRLLIEREGSRNLSVGTSNSFVLRIQNRTRRPLFIRMTESFPEGMDLQGLPVASWIPARQRRSFEYKIVPHTRGSFEVGQTYIRVNSLLGLFRRQMVVDIPHSMRVFPDIKILNTYALLARRNRIDLLGFRMARGRASDVEFDRLRDYQSDDDHRRIDPFASARYRKLITREYQVSRNQNIFFVVDCGRTMAGECGGLTNLDHALNATLMMSYVALSEGDNVGLMAFDDRVRAFLPPTAGTRSKTAMLHALYDLKVSEEEPDYEMAFLTLQRRVRQRSLVVLLTNVMDASSFELLRPHLRALMNRHLPLVLLLRDQDLFDLADSSPENENEFFALGAAAELAGWRETLAGELQRQGALVLDVHPDHSTPELINTYLRIKADQLL
jgi:uncharacterized protein (DUF58 family)